MWSQLFQKVQQIGANSILFQKTLEYSNNKALRGFIVSVAVKELVVPPALDLIASHPKGNELLEKFFDFVEPILLQNIFRTVIALQVKGLEAIEEIIEEKVEESEDKAQIVDFAKAAFISAVGLMDFQPKQNGKRFKGRNSYKGFKWVTNSKRPLARVSRIGIVTTIASEFLKMIDLEEHEVSGPLNANDSKEVDKIICNKK